MPRGPEGAWLLLVGPVTPLGTCPRAGPAPRHVHGPLVSPDLAVAGRDILDCVKVCSLEPGGLH